MDKKKRKLSEAHKKATANYIATHMRRVAVSLNRSTDADIIAHINTLDNIQGYIKSLIRADMNAKGIVPDTSNIAPILPLVHPGLVYTDPDGTWKVIRTNGNDVMIEGENGKTYATTIEDVEKYL